MALPSLEKRQRLSDPVVTAGNRTYLICSQNGLFPDPWGGHVPHEMWGLWDHPIKLLDGFWFALRATTSKVTSWLVEADLCRVHPTHTEFEYLVGGLQIVRRDFAPDDVEGMVIELVIAAPPKFADSIEVVAVFRSDLRPAWLGEEAGMNDHEDRASFDDVAGTLLFEDSGNPWAVLVGAEPMPRHTAVNPDAEVITAPFQNTSGQGANGRMEFTLAFDEENVARLLFYIAGSSEGKGAAASTLQRLRLEHQLLWVEKRARYEGIDRQSILLTPDSQLDEAFRWSKLNCQKLDRQVPALGSGAGAGLPTFPWWFGIDSEYSALPLLQAGLFELAQDTLRLLRETSQKMNAGEPGRVIHELTTTGIVPNRGNLVETPAFTRAVHHCWLWTGDEEFLHEHYPFCKQGVLEYTLGQMDPDGDLCASGRSIMETHEMHAGFETIDVATYTWEALQRLADMAPAVGDGETVVEYKRLAEELGERIRQEWWMLEEGLFADIRATITEVQETLLRIEREILPRDPHRVPEEFMAYLHGLFGPALARRSGQPSSVDLPWLLRHWVTACPLEVGLATPEQAELAFSRLESPEFSGEWGMVLHPTRPDVMSINTGILAMAEVEYGRMDRALALISRMVETLPLHMPGAISEALPDRWCFLQLWSALGPVSPVVQGFLGIQVRAGENRLTVTPNLPAAWDWAALRRLRIGDTYADVHVERSEQSCVVRVTADQVLDLEIGCVFPRGAQVESLWLGGAPVVWTTEAVNAGLRVWTSAQTPAELEIRLRPPDSPTG